ncbi:MAG: alpha/beta hydrolase [Spirochaetales bacterium]|nr:alpha/beta hydrolase [Spirochaetales bacterium]MCF7939220.1 alpha/beta hydrolase [Spirochaetales bacterium]
MDKKAISVRGVSIAYRTEGSGPPVLLVHGNTGSGLWFEGVMDIEGFKTIAPDMPNFGDSDNIRTADIDTYADYLRNLISGLNLPTPVPVIGHSLGGAVSISLALRNPQLVSRLMLVDSAPLDGLHTPEEHYPVIEQYKSNDKLLFKALQAVTPTLQDTALLNRLVEEAKKMNPEAFSANARALDRFDYQGKGNVYTGPVEVLVGDQDILITPDMARRTADAFPDGNLTVLEGVGHSVMIEDPPRFIRILKDFLQ